MATLIRLLGDFDLAEEALHDAFTAAAYLPTAQVGAHELPVAQLWFLSRAVPIELVQFVAAGE